MMILPATAAPAPASPGAAASAEGGFAALLGQHRGAGVDPETAAVLDELADLAETAEVAEQVGTLVAALVRSLGLRAEPTGDLATAPGEASMTAADAPVAAPEAAPVPNLSLPVATPIAAEATLAEGSVEPGDGTYGVDTVHAAPAGDAADALAADAVGDRSGDVTGGDRTPGRTVADAVAAARAAHRESGDASPLGPDVAAAAREAARSSSRAPITPPSQAGEHRVDAARADLAAGVETTATEPTAPPVGRVTSPAASSAVARVLEAIEALESAPPPRVMIIESGEARLRVGLEAGLVRVQLLGERTDAAEQVLRETADALDARGLAADVDGRGRDQRPDHGAGEPAGRGPGEPAEAAAPRARTDRGLRL